MPSLLFGASTERVERGEFTCPECSDARRYDRIVVRRTLCFRSLSILPLGRWGEYIECVDCQGTYRPEVLAYDAGPSTPVVMTEYQRVVLRLLALMVVTDGVIREPEISMMREIYEAVCGHALTRNDVLKEAEAVLAHPVTVARFLASVVGHLNEYGKEQVLRAAAMVSRADGVVHVKERELVVRLGGVMRADPARVGRVLREFA